MANISLNKRASLGILLSIGSLFFSTVVFASDVPMVRVAGTILSADGNEAIIEILNSGEQDVYVEGSTLPGGFVLSRIRKDNIVVSKNGQESVIAFLNGTPTLGSESASTFESGFQVPPIVFPEDYTPPAGDFNAFPVYDMSEVTEGL